MCTSLVFRVSCPNSLLLLLSLSLLLALSFSHSPSLSLSTHTRTDDYTVLLENVMDISHVPFTHHGTQGKRNFARPINYKVKEALKNSGFLVESAMEQPPALTTGGIG